MARQAHQSFKQWPQSLIAVDIPTYFPVYKPNAFINLPKLIDVEVLSSCDPRGSSALSQTSIYHKKPELFASEPWSSSRDADLHAASNQHEGGMEVSIVGAARVDHKSLPIGGKHSQLTPAPTVLKSEGELDSDDHEEMHRIPRAYRDDRGHIHRGSTRRMTHRPERVHHVRMWEDKAELTKAVKRKNECYLGDDEHARKRQNVNQKAGARESMRMRDVQTPRKMRFHHRYRGNSISSLCHFKVLTPFVEFFPNDDDPLLELAFCELEDLCANQRQDFLSDLNSVYIGKKPRFLFVPGRDNLLKRICPLSPSTQFNGYFIGNEMVNRAHMEVLGKWMKDRPLDKVSCALRHNLPLNAVHGGYHPVPLIDHMNEAFCSWLSNQLIEQYVISSGDIELCYDIFVGSSVNCHNTTNQVFREVKQDMEFLHASSSISSNNKKPKTSDSPEKERTVSAGLISNTRQLLKSHDEQNRGELIVKASSFDENQFSAKFTAAEDEPAKVDLTDSSIKLPDQRKEQRSTVDTSFAAEAKLVKPSKDKLPAKLGAKEDKLKPAKVGFTNLLVPEQRKIIKLNTFSATKAKLVQPSTMQQLCLPNKNTKAKSPSAVCVKLAEDGEQQSNVGAQSGDSPTNNANANFIIKPNRVSIKHLRQKKKRSHKYKSQSSKSKRKSSKRHYEKDTSVKLKLPAVAADWDVIKSLTKSEGDSSNVPSLTAFKTSKKLKSTLADQSKIISKKIDKISGVIVASDAMPALSGDKKLKLPLADPSKIISKKNDKISGVTVARDALPALSGDKKVKSPLADKSKISSEKNDETSSVTVTCDALPALSGDKILKSPLADKSKISSEINDETSSVTVAPDASTGLQVSDSSMATVEANDAVGPGDEPILSVKYVVLDSTEFVLAGLVDDKLEEHVNDVAAAASVEEVLPKNTWNNLTTNAMSEISSESESDDVVMIKSIVSSADKTETLSISNPIVTADAIEITAGTMSAGSKEQKEEGEIDDEEPVEAVVCEVTDVGDAAEWNQLYNPSSADDLFDQDVTFKECPVKLDEDLDDVDEKRDGAGDASSKGVKFKPFCDYSDSADSSDEGDLLTKSSSNLQVTGEAELNVIENAASKRPNSESDIISSESPVSKKLKADLPAISSSLSKTFDIDMFVNKITGDGNADKSKVLEQLKTIAAKRNASASSNSSISDDQSSNEELESTDVFIPELNLYHDSFESALVDPYSTVPIINFEPHFDPTCAPIGHATNPFQSTWPVLSAFVNNDIETLRKLNAVPEIESFNNRSVARSTSFLWALVFALNQQAAQKPSADEALPEGTFPHSGSFGTDSLVVKDSIGRGTTNKPSNPLMQAFRQAVEAKRKIALKPSLGSLRQANLGASKAGKPAVLPGRMQIVFGDALKTGGSLSSIVGPLQTLDCGTNSKLIDAVTSSVGIFHSDLDSQFGLLPANKRVSDLCQLLKESGQLGLQHLQALSEVVVHMYDDVESTEATQITCCPEVVELQSEAEKKANLLAASIVNDSGIVESRLEADEGPKLQSVALSPQPPSEQADLTVSPTCANVIVSSSSSLEPTKESSAVENHSDTVVQGNKAADNSNLTTGDKTSSTLPVEPVPKIKTTLLLANTVSGPLVKRIVLPPGKPSKSIAKVAPPNASIAVSASSAPDSSIACSSAKASEVPVKFAELLPPPLPPLSLSSFTPFSSSQSMQSQSASSSATSHTATMSSNLTAWSETSNSSSSLFSCPVDQLVMFPPPSVQFPPSTVAQVSVPANTQTAMLPPPIPQGLISVASNYQISFPPPPVPQTADTLPSMPPPPVPQTTCLLPSMPPPVPQTAGLLPSVPPPPVPQTAGLLPSVPPPPVPQTGVLPPSMPPPPVPITPMLPPSIPPPTLISFPPPPIIPAPLNFASPQVPPPDVSIPPPPYSISSGGQLSAPLSSFSDSSALSWSSSTATNSNSSDSNQWNSVTVRNPGTTTTANTNVAPPWSQLTSSSSNVESLQSSPTISSQAPTQKIHIRRPDVAPSHALPPWSLKPTSQATVQNLSPLAINQGVVSKGSLATSSPTTTPVRGSLITKPIPGFSPVITSNQPLSARRSLVTSSQLAPVQESLVTFSQAMPVRGSLVTSSPATLVGGPLVTSSQAMAIRRSLMTSSPATLVRGPLVTSSQAMAIRGSLVTSSPAPLVQGPLVTSSQAMAIRGSLGTSAPRATIGVPSLLSASQPTSIGGSLVTSSPAPLVRGPLVTSSQATGIRGSIVTSTPRATIGVPSLLSASQPTLIRGSLVTSSPAPLVRGPLLISSQATGIRGSIVTSTPRATIGVPSLLSASQPTLIRGSLVTSSPAPLVRGPLLISSQATGIRGSIVTSTPRTTIGVPSLLSASQPTLIRGSLVTSSPAPLVRGPLLISSQATGVRGSLVTSTPRTTIGVPSLLAASQSTPIRGSLVASSPATLVGGPLLTSSQAMAIRGSFVNSSPRATIVPSLLAASQPTSIRGTLVTSSPAALVRGPLVTSSQATAIRGSHVASSQGTTIRVPSLISTSKPITALSSDLVTAGQTTPVRGPQVSSIQSMLSGVSRAIPNQASSTPASPVLPSIPAAVIEPHGVVSLSAGPVGNTGVTLHQATSRNEPMLKPKEVCVVEALIKTPVSAAGSTTNVGDNTASSNESATVQSQSRMTTCGSSSINANLTLAKTVLASPSIKSVADSLVLSTNATTSMTSVVQNGLPVTSGFHMHPTVAVTSTFQTASTYNIPNASREPSYSTGQAVTSSMPAASQKPVIITRQPVTVAPVLKPASSFIRPSLFTEAKAPANRLRPAAVSLAQNATGVVRQSSPRVASEPGSRQPVPLPCVTNSTALSATPASTQLRPQFTDAQSVPMSVKSASSTTSVQSMAATQGASPAPRLASAATPVLSASIVSSNAASLQGTQLAASQGSSSPAPRPVLASAASPALSASSVSSNAASLQGRQLAVSQGSSPAPRPVLAPVASPAASMTSLASNAASLQGRQMAASQGSSPAPRPVLAPVASPAASMTSLASNAASLQGRQMAASQGSSPAPRPVLAPTASPATSMTSLASNAASLQGRQMAASQGSSPAPRPVLAPVASPAASMTSLASNAASLHGRQIAVSQGSSPAPRPVLAPTASPATSMTSLASNAASLQGRQIAVSQGSSPAPRPVLAPVASPAASMTSLASNAASLQGRQIAVSQGSSPAPRPVLAPVASPATSMTSLATNPVRLQGRQMAVSQGISPVPRPVLAPAASSAPSTTNLSLSSAVGLQGRQMAVSQGISPVPRPVLAPAAYLAPSATGIQPNVVRLQGRQGIGSVPQPVMAPQRTPAHCKPTPNFTIMSPACNTRVFVYNAHGLPVCKEVQQYLMRKGAKLFDPYNIAALCCIEKVECRILIHSGSLNAVHRMPNLLRLKRHLVVTFIAYDRFSDVVANDVSLIFPRAGLMVLDTAMILSCQPAVLDSVCQFVQKQSTAKGAVWQIILAKNIFTKLETLRIIVAMLCEEMWQLEKFCNSSWVAFCEFINKIEEKMTNESIQFSRTDRGKCANLVMEDVRLSEIAQILETYQAQGFCEFIPEELYGGQPNSMLEYWKSCVTLQSTRCYQHRHFLFISDLNRSQLDAKPFLDSGIDVMSIGEFLRGFMAKTVEHRPLQSPVIRSVAGTRITPAKYVDAKLSLGSDIISV